MRPRKLWELRPHRRWVPWYDKSNGYVVRARDQGEAREWAANDCGDEGPDVWLDPLKTWCRELRADGPAGIIMRDFESA